MPARRCLLAFFMRNSNASNLQARAHWPDIGNALNENTGAIVLIFDSANAAGGLRLSYFDE